MKSNEIPAPTAQPAKACEWTNCPTRVGDVCCFDRLDRIAKGAAQPVQQLGWCEGCDPDICPGCGPAAPAQRQPLSDAEIEKLRQATFSTNNPFCPCDSKTMRKAVRAIEAAHNITAAPAAQTGEKL